MTDTGEKAFKTTAERFIDRQKKNGNPVLPLETPTEQTGAKPAAPAGLKDAETPKAKPEAESTSQQNQTEAPAKKTNGASVERIPSRKLMLTGDFGRLYVKVTPSGHILRPLYSEIQLWQKLGHYYFLSRYDGKEKKTVKRYPITSSGYTYMNKVAGITLLTPGIVVADGKEKPNPYVERNPRTRAIDAVILRKIAIGYNPAGNVVGIDKTLYYLPFTYFIQSIQAKMKAVEWENGRPTDKLENPNAGKIGEAGEKPKSPGSWVFFPIEEPIGIWINYEDPAIRGCLDEHTQRQRFADRIAQKIVERNALRDHPAIGIGEATPVGSEGLSAWVGVYGYRHDLTYPDLADLLSQAEKGTGEIEIKADETIMDPDEERRDVHETAGDISSERAEEPAKGEKS